MEKEIKINLRYYQRGLFFAPNKARDFREILDIGWREGFMFSSGRPREKFIPSFVEFTEFLEGLEKKISIYICRDDIHYWSFSNKGKK